MILQQPFENELVLILKNDILQQYRRILDNEKGKFEVDV